MAKRQEGWPVWKITALMLLCFIAGGGLLWASIAIERLTPSPGTQPAGPAQPAPAFSMSGLLLLFSAAALLCGLLCIGWLGYRYWMSIPPWKRQKRYPRRR